jgi:cytochrome d ubiquinol oxidase subunit II
MVVLVPSLWLLFRLVLQGRLDQQFEPLDQRFRPLEAGDRPPTPR